MEGFSKIFFSDYKFVQMQLSFIFAPAFKGCRNRTPGEVAQSVRAQDS